MSLAVRNIVRNPKIAWQNVDEKIVLVSPETKKIHILSGIGGSLWAYLKEPKEVDVLVNMICDEYDVDEKRAKDDIDQFVEALEKEGIITLEELRN